MANETSLPSTGPTYAVAGEIDEFISATWDFGVGKSEIIQTILQRHQWPYHNLFDVDAMETMDSTLAYVYLAMLDSFRPLITILDHCIRDDVMRQFIADAVVLLGSATVLLKEFKCKDAAAQATAINVSKATRTGVMVPSEVEDVPHSDVPQQLKKPCLSSQNNGKSSVCGSTGKDDDPAPSGECQSTGAVRQSSLQVAAFPVTEPAREDATPIKIEYDIPDFEEADDNSSFVDQNVHVYPDIAHLVQDVDDTEPMEAYDLLQCAVEESILPAAYAAPALSVVKTEPPDGGYADSEQLQSSSTCSLEPNKQTYQSQTSLEDSKKRDNWHLGYSSAALCKTESANLYGVVLDPADVSSRFAINLVNETSAAFNGSRNSSAMLQTSTSTDANRWRLLKCEDCGAGFTQFKDFEVHMLKFHPEKCTECGSVFTEVGRQTHVCGVQVIKFYSCPKCGKLFDSIIAVGRHANSSHYGKINTCDECSEGFTTIGQLMRHVYTTHKPVWKCKDCGASFTNQSQLAIHTRWHAGEVVYGCITCAAEFSSENELKAHVDLAHGGEMESTHLCNLCFCVFKFESGLRRHMSVSHIFSHNTIRPK